MSVEDSPHPVPRRTTRIFLASTLYGAATLAAAVDADCFTLSYRGLDGETRVTALAFSEPAQIRDRRIILPVEVEPSASQHILMTIASDGDT